ncbi:MAG: SDR family oxidoreductase [Oligoflexia bacterium]|nr:SDR family oxidoreductase [Oligoflexia bacterium]
MKILVTGGTSKIGEAVMKKIGKNNDLFTTVSSDKSNFIFSKNDFSAKGLNIIQCDFSNFNEAQEDVLKYAAQGFDAVVLNACTKIPEYKLLHEHDLKKFMSFVEANILANIAILQKVLPAMVEKKFGRIVFVSTMAVEMGLSSYSPYIVAKAALEGLIRNIAVDYGKHGIFANTVRPGIIKTERTAPFLDNPKYEIRAKRIIPAGEIGKPEQIAETVALLISEGSYINGQTINVSGGLPLVSSLARV